MAENPKVWDGSAFVEPSYWYWDGSQFVEPESLHVWDGSAFHQIWPAGPDGPIIYLSNGSTEVDKFTWNVNNGETVSFTDAAIKIFTDQYGNLYSARAGKNMEVYKNGTLLGYTAPGTTSFTGAGASDGNYVYLATNQSIFGRSISILDPLGTVVMQNVIPPSTSSPCAGMGIVYGEPDHLCYAFDSSVYVTSLPITTTNPPWVDSGMPSEGAIVSFAVSQTGMAYSTNDVGDLNRYVFGVGNTSTNIGGTNVSVDCDDSGNAYLLAAGAGELMRIAPDSNTLEWHPDYNFYGYADIAVH